MVAYIFLVSRRILLHGSVLYLAQNRDSLLRTEDILFGYTCNNQHYNKIWKMSENFERNKTKLLTKFKWDGIQFELYSTIHLHLQNNIKKSK